MPEPTPYPRQRALADPRTLLWRARTPLRISFAGGSTDFPQVFEQQPTAVLCAGVTLYASAAAYSAAPGATLLRALDRGIECDISASDALPLHRAALRLFRSPDAVTLETDVDVPAGSGLGASSALVASMIGVLGRHRGLDLGAIEVARLAYFVERKIAGQPGGLQDQYATALGGFSFLEFSRRGVEAVRLDVPADARAELESRLLLFRYADQHNDRPANNGPEQLEDNRPYVEALRHLVLEMRRALVSGHIGTFSLLLHEAWELKRSLGHASEPIVEDAYALALSCGALGGKQLGGPGGRHLMLLVDPATRRVVREALGEAGWSDVPIRFAAEGTQVWSGRLT